MHSTPHDTDRAEIPHLSLQVGRGAVMVSSPFLCLCHCTGVMATSNSVPVMSFDNDESQSMTQIPGTVT